MQLAEILNIRTEFETLTQGYTMPCNESDINTIKWFIENGHRSNSLRDGFDNAMTLAKKIKEFADGCTEKTGNRF
jgi:hypothetical protein